jgi:Trypsin-like peptidase domain
MDLTRAIPLVRESTVAIFRYRVARPQSVKKGKVRPAQFTLSWGTGFCIQRDRHVLTAFHVLNNGQPRNSTDRFLAFVVPANQDQAHHFPVTGFPVERPDLDLAVLEIGPCTSPGVHLPALAVTFDAQPDGARVVTVGFPAPEVGALNIDPQGTYMGGKFFLKSHANEGILSAQYQLGPLRVYEFNVGWHHGESGGPVVRLDEPVGAFTIMQQYRGIQSPHGIVAGPHRGCALSAFSADIRRLGATVV